MSDSISVAMIAFGLILIGFGIGLLTKPQYKRDKHGRFTK